MNNVLIPKYCDPNSILLVNGIGEMRKLYCPFQVMALEDVQKLKKGVVIWVDQVATNDKDQLLYVIFANHYKYKYFKILAKF